MNRTFVLILVFAALASPAIASSGGGEAAPASVSRGSLLIESLPLHLKLAGMKKAAAPEVFEEFLVLSAAGPYRFVGAAFEHEHFAKIHTFDRNTQGVFVFAYAIPLMRDEPLAYRLVIDGVWTVDPSNPERRQDRSAGIEVSVARIPKLSDLRLGMYHILGPDDRTAHFLFRAAPGEIVTVCGTFNGWDPFIHEMRETKPGTYELVLPLPPGTNYYAYVYRGEMLSDPLNASKAHRPEGQVVSVLLVGR